MKELIMSLEAKIKQKLEQNDFLGLETLLNQYSLRDFEHILVCLAFDYQSIAIYAVICTLLTKKETTDLHHLAAQLLCHPFCHIEGAYSAALYHTRKAISLSPEDIDSREALLFFNDIPEKLVTDDEAKQIAQEILAVDPASKIAQRTLNPKYFLSNQNNNKTES